MVDSVVGLFCSSKRSAGPVPRFRPITGLSLSTRRPNISDGQDIRLRTNIPVEPVDELKRHLQSLYVNPKAQDSDGFRLKLWLNILTAAESPSKAHIWIGINHDRHVINYIYIYIHRRQNFIILYLSLYITYPMTHIKY